MKPILIDKVKLDLRTLRLTDMADHLDEVLERAETQHQGHLAFLSELTARQLDAMLNRSLERRIKQSHLPRNMTFENFDWGFQPSLNVENLKNLKELTFVVNHQPLLIFGKTGTGKTHMSSALGNQACQAGFRVKFYTFHEILAHLYATLADDTTDEVIARLSRLDLLIIDHVGHIRKKDEYPSLLLDLVCACHDRTSIIVTSNIGLEEWGIVFGNHTLANDIVDRLFHRAHVINIRPGRSYRTEGPNAPHVKTSETSST